MHRRDSLPRGAILLREFYLYATLLFDYAKHMRVSIAIAGAVVLSFLSTLAIVRMNNWGSDAAIPSSTTSGADCAIHYTTRYVLGDSMSEIIQPEQAVSVAMDYYNCHLPERGDIAVINVPGRPHPLLKIIQILPGDRFALQPTVGGLNLLVNDHILRTPKGVAYIFTPGREKMIQLYVESFKGVMPKDTYFVFGTEPDGSFDSTRIGPVTKDELAGKVSEY